MNWTKVGNEFSEHDKEEILEGIKKLEWIQLTQGVALPYSQGEAVKGIINIIDARHLQCAFGYVTHDIYVVAVESQYSDAIVRHYWVDDGIQLSCIGSDPVYFNKKGEPK